MSRYRSSLIAGMAVITVGCGGDGPADPEPNPDAAGISVTPGALQFDALGLTSKLAAAVIDLDGNLLPGEPVAWSHTVAGVVSVSAGGVVTALGNGKDTVIATSSGHTARVPVEVAQVAAGVEIAQAQQTFTVAGASRDLSANVVDGNGRPMSAAAVSWQSSDPAVLHVDQDGLVTAAGHGEATISASASGTTATLAMQVQLNGPVGPPLLGSERPCAGGNVALFKCSGVNLLSYLTLPAIGEPQGGDLNDMWGWTDPQTGTEYALVGRHNGIAFVGLADPTRPVYLGYLPRTVGASNSVWHDVKVYQNHAFVVSDRAGQHGMQVFDLTELRNHAGVPRTFQPTHLYSVVASAHNIAINEESGFAYIVGANSGGNTCGGGLHIVDISNPTAPAFAGCFADPQTGRSGTGYTHDVQCVIYSGPDQDWQGSEVCLGSNETHLSIADVTDKENAEAISRASYPAVQYTHQGWLTEDQRHFLLNDELDELYGETGKTRTLIWDVADLDDPVLVGEFLGPTAASDHNHYIRGNRMYASNYQFGLRVIDVSNPVAPVQLGYFDTAPDETDTPGFGGSWSNYPFFESGIVLATSGQQGLFVFRIP